MKEIHINQKILQAMRLSSEEKVVFDVLLKNNNIYGVYSSKIAKKAGVDNRIVARILVGLETAGVAVKVFKLDNIRPRWKYKKGLETLINGPLSELKFHEKAAICAAEEFGEEDEEDDNGRGCHGSESRSAHTPSGA